MTESLKSAFQTIPLYKDIRSADCSSSQSGAASSSLTVWQNTRNGWTRWLTCNNMQRLCCHSVYFPAPLPASCWDTFRSEREAETARPLTANQTTPIAHSELQTCPVGVFSPLRVILNQPSCDIRTDRVKGDSVQILFPPGSKTCPEWSDDKWTAIPPLQWPLVVGPHSATL